MLEELLKKYQSYFHPIVPFEPKHDKLLLINFTANNQTLTDNILNNTGKFTTYMEQQLQKAGATYGIGGYNEHRTIYSRSTVFSSADGGEPRRLHLGIDIWGKAGTPVFAPLNAIVHSYAFNNNFGDYGVTIILQHQLENVRFYTLYGHLALNNLVNLKEGEQILAGQEFANFGVQSENGSWPPHLHFQLIKDIESKKGDYPGVCRYNERVKYLENCPNPDLILQLVQYAKGKAAGF